MLCPLEKSNQFYNLMPQQNFSEEIQISNPFFILKKKETQEKIDFDTLIKYHKIYGNKWKQISNHIFKSSDAFIKNMFYTLTRKALRKINVYIEIDSKLKNKKAKPFKLNFVFKLANLAQSQRINHSHQEFNNQNDLKGFYTKLLYNLLEVGKTQLSTFKVISQSQKLSVSQKNFKENIDSLIQNLKTIEKIFIEQNLTKKGRTKKKFPKKGLIEKAYSSKAFKNSLDDFDLLSLDSLSTSHSKQYKQTQVQLENFENSENLSGFQVLNDNSLELKNQLDRFFQEKAFDLILFQ